MLSRKQIMSEMEKGNIQIAPFEQSSVGPVSVDLRLSNVFRVFRKARTPVKVIESLDADSITSQVKLSRNQTLTLSPGQLVLGCTMEKVTLPPNIAGTLTGRSRFARVGLAVHVSSSLVQPGSQNVQVLEILNNSPFPLELTPGVRVCQIMFHYVDGAGKDVYNGKYRFQAAP
jgi:dCTP deaminase